MDLLNVQCMENNKDGVHQKFRKLTSFKQNRYVQFGSNQ